MYFQHEFSMSLVRVDICHACSTSLLKYRSRSQICNKFRKISKCFANIKLACLGKVRLNVLYISKGGKSKCNKASDLEYIGQGHQFSISFFLNSRVQRWFSNTALNCSISSSASRVHMLHTSLILRLINIQPYLWQDKHMNIQIPKLSS